MSVPNGSPTRCATTSAWWTAARTAATSAGHGEGDEHGADRQPATPPRRPANATSGAATVQRPAIAAAGQCSAEASVRPNSPIGASNGCASSVMQKKVPRIVPLRRREAGPARVLEALAGLEHRLVADDREAAHFVDVAVRVGDDPVARDQLAGDVAAVADRDRVGERVLARVAGPTARAGDARRRWS